MSLVKHPPRSIIAVANELVAHLHGDDRISAALDATLDVNPDADNVRVRWLQKRNAYEVTVVLDANRMQT